MGRKTMVGSRSWNHTDGLIYNASGQVPVVDNCYAYMFTNLGDTACRVNGMVVFPSATPATALGDSRTVGAHVLDIYQGGTLKVSFFGAGVAPAIEIVQFFYLEPQTP